MPAYHFPVPLATESLSVSSHPACLTVDTICGILTSPEFDRLWARHYISKRDNPETHVLADELRALAAEPKCFPKSVAERTDLLTFMRTLIDLERGAVPGDAGLDQIAGYLATISVDTQCPKPSDLPDEQKRVLKIVALETAQVPFKPFSSFWRATKSIGEHIKEEAIKHPVLFAAFSALAFSGLYVSKTLGGRAARIAPEDTGLTNFNLDAVDNNAPLQVDHNLINLDYVGGCHDHIKQLVWGNEELATFLVDNTPIKSVLGEQCIKLDSFATNSQDFLDWYHTRLDYFIKNPAHELGTYVTQNDGALEAYKNAVEYTSAAVYSFNDWENAAIHGIILAGSIVTSAKMLHLRDEERAAILDSSQDFLWRTVLNTPLNYTLSLGAIAHTAFQDGYLWTLSQGLNPEAVWAGVGGLVAGQTVHKLAKLFNRKAHGEKVTQDVRTHLEEASNLEFPVPAPMQKKSLAQRFRGPAIGAVVGAAAMYVDNAMTGGQITYSILGGATVVGTYVVVNVPEDTGFHLGIGTVGGTVGLALGAGWLGLKTAWAQAARALPGRKSKPQPLPAEITSNAPDPTQTVPIEPPLH